MKIPTIELTIEDESKEGIFALGYVTNPAFEEDTEWVYLSQQEIELKIVDEERRIVVGFIMVPDKEVPRNQIVNGKMMKFNIKFSKQTILKAGELFMKNMNNNKATDNHEKPLTGVSVIELWTVEDPKNDKSNIYNLKPKGGELAVISKFYNDKAWEDVKAGKWKGFSIEGLFNGFDQLLSKSKEELIIEELKIIVNG